MTEAFVYGVASSGSEVGRIGIVHTVTGGFFAAIAPILVKKFGTIGLVAANCVAMLGRTCYSIYFASAYIAKDRKERISSTASRVIVNMLPHPATCASFVLTGYLTYWSKQKLSHQVFNIHDRYWLLLTVQHVSIGVACLVSIAILSYFLESNFRASLRAMLRPKQA
jgi:hypothetical protein